MALATLNYNAAAANIGGALPAFDLTNYNTHSATVETQIEIAVAAGTGNASVSVAAAEAAWDLVQTDVAALAVTPSTGTAIAIVVDKSLITNHNQVKAIFAAAEQALLSQGV